MTRPGKETPCCGNCKHWVWTLDDFTKVSECMVTKPKGTKTHLDHHCERWEYTNIFEPWTPEQYRKVFGVQR